tara:strand:- start:31953 stop:32867 length:915 start_codon:yes stop_codon:yes gene_type:complete
MDMRVLVVGGTGLIGGHAALHLAQAGHEVTIMARSPSKVPSLAQLPFVATHYVDDDVADGRLQGYDWLVFAAGVDIRQLPQDGSVTEDAFYTRYNSEGIPRFFAAAKAAGIKRAAYIGTFYPQVAPEKIETSAYVRSRKLADDAIRAMSDDSFAVCSLNAPFVLGHLPGLEIPHLYYNYLYTKGLMEGVPLFAPEGGTNHITSASLAEAVQGALEKGEPGRAYLVGDENLTWKAYFEMWCEEAGNPQTLEVRSDEHPLLPDIIMFAGRGATVSYTPEGVKELGYGTGRIRDEVAAIVASFEAAQ